MTNLILRRGAMFAPLLLFLLFVPGQKPQSSDQLIVFVPSQDSDLYQRVASQAIPLWTSLAEDAGLDVRLIETTLEGAPDEVKQLPTLVFQHQAGRNFYYGRYLDEGRIATWLRTGKRRVSQLSTDQKTDLFVAESGRLTEAAIIKVTEITGAVPDTYNPDLFREQVMSQMAQSMTVLTRSDAASLLQTDRKVFFDIYPYQDKLGMWSVSLAIFSPFDCIHPVYTTDTEPISGSFEEAFSKAGRQLEEAWISWKESDSDGDAYEAVTSTTRILSWEELGLGISGSIANLVRSIPANPAGWRAGRYELSHSSGEEPELVFQFASPLDGYAGAIDSMAGYLNWPSPPQLQGISGSFDVPVRAVNMGNTGLNLKVWDKYLKEKKHPKLSLDLPPFQETKTISDTEPLVVTLPGMMTINGKARPVSVNAEFMPVMAPSLREALQVDLQFGLDISDWKIDGPDGPEPANHTMQFYGTIFLIHN